MYQKFEISRGDSPVSIIGAGIAGAWQALLFAQAGHAVTLHERSDAAMTLSTSHWAGGMLAPWCEAETSEPVIGRLGIRSLDLWREHLPRNAVQRLAGGGACRATAPISNALPSSPPAIGGSTPGLERTRTVAGRPFPRRRCSMPMKAMSSRAACCRNCMRASSPPAAPSSSTATPSRTIIDGIVIDCRGLAARDEQPNCAASRAR